MSEHLLLASHEKDIKVKIFKEFFSNEKDLKKM